MSRGAGDGGGVVVGDLTRHRGWDRQWEADGPGCLREETLLGSHLQSLQDSPVPKVPVPRVRSLLSVRDAIEHTTKWV